MSGIDLNNITLSGASEADSDDDSFVSSSSRTNLDIAESLSAAGGSREYHATDAEDEPPAFPALNSAQRQGASSREASNKSSKAATILRSVAPPQIAAPGLMPPPSGLAPPRAAGLLAPPSTSALTAPVGVGGASGMQGAETKRKKVALAPGCSPLDWARLKNSTDLRGGITSLQRVTLAELKKHNTREDAWSVFYGKVYNITPYLRFHPGGEDELLRVAGRDGTRLFALTHSWVNIDAMIDTAMVGILSKDP
ncbi:cytochrome b5 [Testicularia cyperi]|uniref:Cytochrome b5 n=1 Tax=Testicularia cyperi TaxID=1882483 RepID=A0A317XL73_9BASI|nr:cytochrome b5 [Testicularia cyperi]